MPDADAKNQKWGNDAAVDVDTPPKPPFRSAETDQRMITIEAPTEKIRAKA